VGFVLISCTTAPSNGPSSAPSPSAAASPTDVPGSAGLSPSPGEVSQTDTDWGRIWDAIPVGFPKPPGSILEAEPIEPGPTSANLSVGAAVEDVVSFYETALPPLGFEASTQGPLENGGWVIDATQPGSDCQLQLTLTPLSGVTYVAILYGAGCRLG
jgi:hypothetical protein